MNLKMLPFFLALLFAFSPATRAQDGEQSAPIKVTIKKNPDHSYVAMKTDPDAHSAENSLYAADGRLMQTTIFILDDQGKPLGGFVYSPKGSQPRGTLLHKIRFQYDAMGRVSEMDYFTPTDQLLSRQVYTYDDTGKVKIVTYDAGGKITKTDSAAVALPDKR